MALNSIIKSEIAADHPKLGALDFDSSEQARTTLTAYRLAAQPRVWH
jgi:hypothetical protein